MFIDFKLATFFMHLPINTKSLWIMESLFCFGNQQQNSGKPESDLKLFGRSSHCYFRLKKLIKELKDCVMHS